MVLTPPDEGESNFLTQTAPAPAHSERKPLVRKWWLWTAVGVVAVGTALAVGLTVGRDDDVED